MLNKCVTEWLRELRRTTECYDDFAKTEKMCEYENICDCRSVELKFGRMCRTSTVFDDSIESLKIVPVLHERFESEDLAEDVVMWKKQLRCRCSEEEDNCLESEDLITNVNEEKNDAEKNFRMPGHFPPVDEQDKVEIRRKPSNTMERPKTFSTNTLRKNNNNDEPVNFTGLARLEIKDDSCYKFFPKQTLRYQNNTLMFQDGRNPSNDKCIRDGVTLQRNAKLITKTELEMVDGKNTIYRLTFRSAKDAQNIRELYKSPSSVKNAPWWQLKKLLKKRSSRDLLEEKGIYKNEPIFGNTLEQLCSVKYPVPEVVTRLTELIERKENITSVGLYRTTANMATMQNIRCEINCGRWAILEKYCDDVDVLASTLKLFFRELKRPLIDSDTCEQLQTMKTKTEIGRIIDSMSRSYKSTLEYLVKHLLKVCQYKEDNKMDFHNISICWAPTLIQYDNCVDFLQHTTQIGYILEDILTFYSTQWSSDQSAKVPEPVAEPTDFALDVIRTLTEKIEKDIAVEGIYRKSGSNTKITKIMKDLDKKNLNVLSTIKHDVHDLCCVFKKYLAQERKNIVPDEFFLGYLNICDNPDDEALKAEIFRSISELPRKIIIETLFSHLHRVVEHQDKNKISLNTLSEIWMMTLTSPNKVQNYRQKMPKYTKLFKMLINMNFNVKNLPDVVCEPRSKCKSKYENVPEDTDDDREMSKL